MENMVIDDRFLFFGSLFISLSATQFINTYSKPGGIMENMVIDDRFLFFGSLFISLSATQFLL